MPKCCFGISVMMTRTLASGESSERAIALVTSAISCSFCSSERPSMIWICATGMTASSDELAAQSTQTLITYGEGITLVHLYRSRDGADHDEAAGRQAFTTVSHHVGQHGNGGSRMTQYGSAGTGLYHFTVDLHDHTDVFQIHISDIGHAATGDEAAGRGVVGYHALEVKLEVLVA